MFVARGQVHRNIVNARRERDNKPAPEDSVNENTARDADGGAPNGNADTNGATEDAGTQPSKDAAIVDTKVQGAGEGSGKASSPKPEEQEFQLWELDQFTGFPRAYLRASNTAIMMLRHSWFNSAVMLCISWASLSVGFQTYEALASSVILDDLDLCVLAVFILEAVLKIMAEGPKPWVFFTGKERRWNCFDFGIIVMSLPIWGSALGGGNIAILRMLRLMRIMKLVKRIPQLYMIVMGLIGGLKSIGYILLLLFLVFYLYAISGMYAWKDNDAFHFRSVPIAMVTLFRMSTLENWSNVRLRVLVDARMDARIAIAHA